MLAYPEHHRQFCNAGDLANYALYYSAAAVYFNVVVVAIFVFRRWQQIAHFLVFIVVHSI